MGNEKLTELIRDEQNRLLRKDTGREVTAISLGVPVPFNIQLERYVPAKMASLLKGKYQQLFGVHSNIGNVDTANAFLDAVPFNAIAPCNPNYVPIRKGESIEQVITLVAAIQFYKI